MSEQTPKFKQLGQILANECVAPGIFVMEMNAPLIAQSARPGQFVHITPVGSSVQLLRMPFCVYDVDGQFGTVEICYQVVGEGTEHLSRLSLGSNIDIIGPIGNGWSIPDSVSHALLIGGGLGAAPLNLLARQLAGNGARVDIALGAPTARRIACRDRLLPSVELSGGELFVSTDDGTEGVHGFVTQISDELLRAPGSDFDYVCVCGPGPMEANAVKVPLELGICCEASFERLMACGIGACLSCVVDTVDGRKRCCVDGPVFNASEVIW